MVMNKKIPDTLMMILLTILLVLVIVLFFFSTIKNCQNTKRLESNIEALRTEMVEKKSTDGKETATAKQQTLTRSELKEIMKEELSTLNIKARDVKQVANIAERQNFVFRVDTVRIHDTIMQYRYKDDWIDFSLTGDSANISARDCLLVVNHARTRKFLWWTIRRYSGQTTIKNYSPYTKIEAITTIDIENKR